MAKQSYIDYIDLNYKPTKTDLICDFYLEAGKNLSFKAAAGGVAAESSIGTWTPLTTFKDYMDKLSATVFDIKGKNFRVAYPIDLFEAGNMPNTLSGIAGNLFGLKDIKAVRLNDIIFPNKLIKTFPGPKYGIKGIRKIVKTQRPLVGTIVKPKLGLNVEDHAKVAFEAWVGGCDVVKDDENLSGQKFNPFKKRFLKTIKLRNKAEKITGEKKIYMVNITAPYDEMIKRAEFVLANGGEYVMVDVLTIGWSALQSLRAKNYPLVYHAHRAGHAAFTKSHTHGINMKVIAKVCRLIGMDQLHVGTGVGKMGETKKEVKDNIEALTGKMGKMKKTLPVASGGLEPGMIPPLYKLFGKDVVIQMGGGIHGHPDGTLKGSIAGRQALDATLKKISLKKYAKNHEELNKALKKWK